MDFDFPSTDAATLPRDSNDVASNLPVTNLPKPSSRVFLTRSRRPRWDVISGEELFRSGRLEPARVMAFGVTREMPNHGMFSRSSRRRAGTEAKQLLPWRKFKQLGSQINGGSISARRLDPWCAVWH